MFHFNFVRLLLLILASSSVSVWASHPCTFPPDRLAPQFLSLGSLSRGRLVLLTRSLDLFDTVLNSSGLVLSPRSTSLNGTLGVNPSYRRYSGVISNSIVTFMNGTGVILFVAATPAADEGESQPKSGQFERLFLYNDTSEAMTRHSWTFDTSLEGMDGLVCVWLSSAPPFMFVLLKDRYNGWLLVRVRIAPQGRLQMAGPLVRLCLYALNDQLYGVGLSEERCPLQTNSTKLPITGGLHYDGTFHLFTGSYVFKFSDKPYDDFEKASPEIRAQPMPISKLLIRDWLACGNNKEWSQLMSTTANSVPSNGTRDTLSGYSKFTRVCWSIILLLLVCLLILFDVMLYTYISLMKRNSQTAQEEQPEEPEEPGDSLEEVQVQVEQANGDLKDTEEADEEAVVEAPVSPKSHSKLKESQSKSSFLGAVGRVSPRSLSLYRAMTSLESKRSSLSKETVKSSPTWTEKCLLLPTSPFPQPHSSLVKQKSSNSSHKSSSMALTTFSPSPKPKSVNLDL